MNSTTYEPDGPIYADPSNSRFLLFVFMNVFLALCMLIIILYLLKGQKDFAAKMNAMRKDKGRRTERVTDRTVFDFNHSPEEAEIMETHDRVMVALNLEDEPAGAAGGNPLKANQPKVGKKTGAAASKQHKIFQL
jgi:hypothetical protein